MKLAILLTALLLQCGGQEQSPPLRNKHYHITLYDGGAIVREWVGHDVSFSGSEIYFTEDDFNRPIIVNGTFIVEVETE